jgi:hypothetical protein
VALLFCAKRLLVNAISQQAQEIPAPKAPVLRASEASPVLAGLSVTACYVPIRYAKIDICD